MIVFESQYKRIEFIESQSLVKNIMLSATEKITHKEFQEGELELLKAVLEKKPRIVLVNLTNMRYVISPQMQEWLVENVYVPGGLAGVKKVAYLVSEDFIAQLSAEQTVSEYKAPQFDNRFFSNEKEAMDWLLKQ